MFTFSTIFSTIESETNHRESGQQNILGELNNQNISPVEIIIQKGRYVEVHLRDESNFSKIK